MSGFISCSHQNEIEPLLNATVLVNSRKLHVIINISRCFLYISRFKRIGCSIRSPAHVRGGDVKKGFQTTRKFAKAIARFTVGWVRILLTFLCVACHTQA